MNIEKQKVAEALIDLGEKYGKSEKYFTINEEADKLIWNNHLAYLFAVIFDQSMPAEKVWEIPYLLKQRLGFLDCDKIAYMSDEELIEIFNQKPKLHRFPKKMAINIKKACLLLIEKYDGKTENIWNDKPRSDDLHRRFEEFNLIGQKKASMATNILVRDYGIEVKDKRGIDISYDIHVRKVLLRTGLAEEDDMDLMIKTARMLNPEYPGALDNPCWIIGRRYCHPTKPLCDKCPISNICQKLLSVKLPENV